MPAKIKHLAIISDNYALLSRFYEALFGMRTSKSPRPESAVAIGDGYVGMNIIPQKVGRQAGLEHFGLEVESVEKIAVRLREKYPSVQLIKRPTNRPFAGISTHDPEGYVFDLSQQDMSNRGEVYVEGEWKQERYVTTSCCARLTRPISLSSIGKSMSFKKWKSPPTIPATILPTAA
jgi:predicted enzyme related to lactoylglutathione lyase